MVFRLCHCGTVEGAKFDARRIDIEARAILMERSSLHYLAILYWMKFGKAAGSKY
jgi:hypothetical protein